MIQFDYRFTPADGSTPRDIHVIIEKQESEARPLKLTIDWGDGQFDRMTWRGPPLTALEFCSRYVAFRIPDHCELWGPGTLHPEVERPAALVRAEEVPAVEEGDT
ncbi:MAG: hypothetical protein U0441_12560 [Polyangiaceae bacterium]